MSKPQATAFGSKTARKLLALANQKPVPAKLPRDERRVRSIDVYHVKLAAPTLAGAVTAGSNVTVVVSSLDGVTVGCLLYFASEFVVVESINSGAVTITADFEYDHASGERFTIEDEGRFAAVRYSYDADEATFTAEDDVWAYEVNGKFLDVDTYYEATRNGSWNGRPTWLIDSRDDIEYVLIVDFPFWFEGFYSYGYGVRVNPSRDSSPGSYCVLSDDEVSVRMFPSASSPVLNLVYAASKTTAVRQFVAVSAVDGNVGHSVRDEDYWYAAGVSTLPGVSDAWNSAIPYRIGNIATYLGTSYICILSHTNQAPPNVTYWFPITTSGGAYDPTATYSKGQYVTKVVPVYVIFEGNIVNSGIAFSTGYEGPLGGPPVGEIGVDVIDANTPLMSFFVSSKVVDNGVAYAFLKPPTFSGSGPPVVATATRFYIAGGSADTIADDTQPSYAISTTGNSTIAKVGQWGTYAGLEVCGGLICSGSVSITMSNISDFPAPGAAGNVLTSNGSAWTSAAPSIDDGTW